MHGVPWSLLTWELTDARPARLTAGLDWTRSALLAVFPFRHRLELAARLRPDSLTLETTLIASPDGPVPVSFGFHPYVGLPELPRAEWRVELPAMRRLVLDRRGIPTRGEEPFARLGGRLGERALDDGFAVLGGRPAFVVAGG